MIARHDEDLAWVDRLGALGMRVTVYNKGAPLASVPACVDAVVAAPNMGREAHSYLLHIVSAYRRLDDYTVFLQGDPFFHCPDLLARLGAFMRECTALTKAPVRRESAAAWRTPRLYREFGNEMATEGGTLAGGSVRFPWIPLKDTYERVLGAPAPAAPFAFTMGAQFAASRNTLRSRPRALYRRALGWVLTCDKAPWALERMWRRVFSTPRG